VGWAPPPVVSPITVTRWMACRFIGKILGT
jgi:hypothetical protein